ncbi:UNVERIFIED_CONTAM: hypothetical protein HDU68_001393, partial [Siphonaria sp. JEL0065]
MIGRRLFTTAKTATPTLAQLVSKLRKETSAPIVKARVALEQNNFDFDLALKSLQQLALKSSEKLANRKTKQGLVAVWIGDHKSGLVEVNCETDFVERSDLFKDAVRDVRETAAASLSSLDSTTSTLNELSSEALAAWVDSATIPTTTTTVKDRTIEAIAKLGENIRVRKALVSAAKLDKDIVFGGYTHGGDDLMGKIAGLVALR